MLLNLSQTIVKLMGGFLFLLVIFRESTQTLGLPDRRMWAPGSENTELHAREESPELGKRSYPIPAFVDVNLIHYMSLQKGRLTKLLGAAIPFLSSIFPTISQTVIHTFPLCNTSSKDLYYSPQSIFSSSDIKISSNKKPPLFSINMLQRGA